MPRANRYHLLGRIWHITHRCHKRDFLLKFNRDKQRWIHWLFEARKRYELTVLNFMVTSNHIHLLVESSGKEDTIARAIQLIAGRTAQEYNIRKSRKGAFWEDRYHATAIESGIHLRHCMAYIDMNMCRAGVVQHPSEWEHCAYHRIQDPPKRYNIINRHRTAELLGLKNTNQLIVTQQEWIEESIKHNNEHDAKWSKSIAVGSKDFVEDISKELGTRARHRNVKEESERFVLKEASPAYSTNFRPKNKLLSSNNTFFWNLSVCE